MGKLPYSIYLNESLLDNIGSDEVLDVDENESASNVCFRFTFNFNTYSINSFTTQMIKNVFFELMESGLQRMRGMGFVKSWKFYKKIESISRFDILKTYSKCFMENKDKKMGSSTFAMDIWLDDSDVRGDSFGTVCASLIHALVLGGLCDLHAGVRLVVDKLVDDSAVMQFCVIRRYTGSLDSDDVGDIDFKKVQKDMFRHKWLFYAGDYGGNLDRNVCESFAGKFVRTAGMIGLMKADDDEGSRYLVLTFGESVDSLAAMLLSSEGEVLGRYPCSVRQFIWDRFLDNGLMRISFFSESYNFIRKDGSLLLDKNCIKCGLRFNDGYVCVNIRPDVWSFFDKDGNILGGNQFPYASDFKNGYAVVGGNGKKRNIIDNKGVLRWSTWYETVEIGDNGIMHVYKYDSSSNNLGLVSNYADADGNLLLDEWVSKSSRSIVNGFAKLIDNYGLYNFMRADGSLVSKEWFKNVCGYPQNGVFAFEKRQSNGCDMWQFMDVDTNKVLFDGEMFDDVECAVYSKDFNKNFYIVSLNGDGTDGILKMYNLVSVDGKKCVDDYKFSVKYIGYDCVCYSNTQYGKRTVAKWGGDVIVDNLTDCEHFIGGYAKVTMMDEHGDKKINFIRSDGSLVSDSWLDCSGKMRSGFVVVNINNVLTCKGVLLFGKEGKKLNRIYTVVPDELVVVEIFDDDNKSMLYNMFDADGKQLLSEWTRFRPVADRDGVVRVGPAAFVDYSGNFTSII